ncbi:MAG: glycosyltransferase family 2 protein [Candidatus Zixiibacteriota bacterium]
MPVLFWGSAFVIFWAYIGYPLALWLISLFHVKKVAKQDWYPPVTVIITAYNEEKRIANKIDNTLALEYPKDKLDIIVVSDASTDQTEEIVRSYFDRGIKLLRIAERHGKHYGQGHGIQMATTDIVVLTDATTFLKADAIAKIVRSYADPTIGCVSGEDRIEETADGSAGEGAYVRYEMKLRALENQVGSLVGASGCFFSVRKYLCYHWIGDMSSDFYMPIVTRMHGLRAVVEHQAIGYYRVLANPDKEFMRKVRTVVHGLEVLFEFKEILNVFKYGTYTLQMFSHKLCRWLVPFAIIVLLIANLFLWRHGLFYQALLAGQALLYVMALLAYLLRPLQQISLFKIPLFFVMVNLSILVAWWKYLTGQKYVVWDATKR